MVSCLLYIHSKLFLIYSVEQEKQTAIIWNYEGDSERSSNKSAVNVSALCEINIAHRGVT